MGEMNTLRVNEPVYQQGYSSYMEYARNLLFPYSSFDIYNNFKCSHQAWRVVLRCGPFLLYALFYFSQYPSLHIISGNSTIFSIILRIQLLDLLPYVKPIDDDYVLLTRFLNVLAVARPENSTLKVDEVSGRFTEIQHEYHTAPRLDDSQLLGKGLEMSRAAHALVAAIVPNYLNVVKYGSQPRGVVSVGRDPLTGLILACIQML